MKTKMFFVRTIGVCLPVLLLSLGSNVFAESRNIKIVDEVETVPVTRIITNHIEVRMPRNVFVDSYRTNFVDVYHTNIALRTITNTVPVEVTRTNFITRYETNINTINLTNWQTVLAFKTNFISRQLTNVVEIDVPAAASQNVAAAVATPAAATPASAVAQPVGEFYLEAMRTDKAPTEGQFEVSVKLKAANDSVPAFTSHEWQVKRTDGSVLLFGKEPEFKRELPFGVYTVEVKARTSASATVRVRGSVEVTREGVFQQKPAVVLSAR